MIFSNNIGLKDPRGKRLQGDYGPETIAYMTELGIPDNSDPSIYTGLTNTELWDVINDFALLQKERSYWPKLKAEYIFIGDSASQFKYNFLNPEDTDAAFRLDFSGSWVYDRDGIQGNGSNTYGDTHFNQLSNSAVNDESFGFYSITDVEENSVDIGLADFSDGNRGTHIFSNFDGTSSFRVRHQTKNSDGDEGIGNSNSLGFYASRKTGSGNFYVTLRDTEHEVTNSDDGYVFDLDFYLGARNTEGTDTSHSSRKYSFFFLASGFTAQEMTDLRNDVESLQVALNRNV